MASDKEIVIVIPTTGFDLPWITGQDFLPFFVDLVEAFLRGLRGRLVNAYVICGPGNSNRQLLRKLARCPCDMWPYNGPRGNSWGLGT